MIGKQAISLFSGAGGDTLGLKRAGYHVVAFSEFKKPAIATHLAAFPESKLLVCPETGSTDITLIPDHVFETYRGRIDLIFAGFPCQSFSHAGKKRMDDPRGELVHQFVRAVKCVGPRYIVGENVPGLLSRQGRDPITQELKPVIDIISGLFEAIGYRITYRIVKAVECGVPQERKRLILVGAKEGYPIMPWDHPIHIEPAHHCIREFLEDHLIGAVPFPKEHIPDDLPAAYWILPLRNPQGNPIRICFDS